ncbi:DUF11 domain-containing protein [Marinihelvus fidelis]|uniref:DUF11 domain-containing protein n=1 Tax=Marinihelvus fidelis TaxID=2613842 RepID=A0A5N0TE10_9GAMM|nr:DUF11 domain-containing protein [Marinihelvus fidelis]KAA9132694.1 DUF11 domain-containing protein [Marinihelvus fidelis]
MQIAKVGGVVTLLFAMLATAAHAQDPALDVASNPATPLIGEEVCTTVGFSNQDVVNVGYGPYVFATVPPGVTITANTYLGIQPPVEFVGTVDASGTINDPISGTAVAAEPGSSAYIVRFPVGSVSGGQPPLNVEVCGQVEPGAEIGQPLEINMLPGFEYGDTPTGDNGPITGSGASTATVIPQLARVEKTADVPEGERPPGPSNTFTYTYQVNVSEGVTLDMPALTDVLPDPAIQWTGAPISVAAIQGVLCSVLTEPNLPDTPGGTLMVGCDSLTGTPAENDLVVSIPVYITDILDESDNGATQQITNTVELDYSYQGTDYSNTDDAQVTAKHLAVQKSVTPDTVVPGDTLSYTVNFQVTDYDESIIAGSITDLSMTDILGDGLDYAGNATLTLAGSTGPIIPTVSAGPGAGQTTLLFDIAPGATTEVALGSRGSLQYQADVSQAYADGDDVVAADGLGNNISADFTHSDSAGASGQDGSSAGVDIIPNQAIKSLVAPIPLPDPLAPGDTVTFRLEMDIPSEDTLSISLTDYLPLPVVVVTDIDPDTDIVVPNIVGGPLLDPVYSSDPATNSFTLTWPNPAGQGVTRVAADVTVTISSEPFADGLFLTNLLLGTYENSDGITQSTDTAAGFNVGAPDVFITKGVFSVDNPNATVSPAPPADPALALVDSDALDVDAGDAIEYILTVENRGSTPAYNIDINDATPAGLACQAPTITDGTGQGVSFTGTDLDSGIVVPGPLAGNDGNPAGGGEPFGADTLLVRYTCVVQTSAVAGDVLVNTATMNFTSVSTTNDTFPERSDDAMVALATPTVQKSVIEVIPGYAGDTTRVQIGESVRYQVDITVPEGTSPDIYFEDLLDTGLAFESLESITASPGLTTDVTGGFGSVTSNAAIVAQGGGDENAARLLRIGPNAGDPGFGTVTNSNTDNATAETITLVYLARVINNTGNVRGQQRNNRAQWSWTAPQGTQTTQGSAANVRVVEPGIAITKVFDPATADRSIMPLVNIRVRHNGGSDGTAFELNLVDDDFPNGIDPVGGSLTTVNCNAPPDSLGITAGVLTASWAVFEIGDDCTLQIENTIDPTLPAGTLLENCAQVQWTSMDGDLSAPLPGIPLSVERTGDPGDIGGPANTYRGESCAQLKIFDVGITKAVIDSNQVHTGNNSGVEELAIGEEVTFQVTVVLPEGEADNLVITDTLPTSSMLLELVDAVYVPLPAGTNLDTVGGPPALVSSDELLGDGLDDTVTATFPNPVTNADPLDTTAENNSFQFLVTAVVRDLPANQNLDEDDNVARAEFGSTDLGQQFNVTDTARVRALEPFLSVVKTGDVTSAEVGDVVHYTLVVSHTGASGTDAFDLDLADTLPPELVLDTGSVVVGDNCTIAPDAGPAGSGNTVAAGWSAFPLGAVCEIGFDATVDVSAVSGDTISNTTDLAWTTLDGTVPAGTEERSYTTQGSWDIVIADPGLTKMLVDSNIVETPDQEITIGETMTFEIVAEFPDGTTDDVYIGDVLPYTATAIEIVSSRIVSIGADLTLDSGAVGDPGDDCIDCSQGDRGFDDAARWNLGNVVNVPNAGAPPGPDDQVVFEVVGIVLDDPINQGIPVGEDFVYNNAGIFSENFSSTDQAAITLVEPKLELRHFIEAPDRKVAFVDALDPLTVRLEIAHTGDSSATALSVTVDDVLDADIWWTGGPVTSDCPGLATDATPADNSSGTVSFSFDALPLAQGSCSISFPVQVSDAPPATGTLLDQSSLAWESAPGSAESRDGTDGNFVSYVIIGEAALSKQPVSSSVALTGSSQGDPLLPDLTIGETLTYELVTYLSDGQFDQVRVADSLPAGSTLLTASVVSIGSDLVTELAGTPMISGNTVSFDFGEVTNSASGAQDNTIVVRVTAQVADDTNTDTTGGAVTLSNSGELTFAALQGAPQTRSAVAVVDIVEPLLELDKQFGDVVDGRVPVTLTVENVGTAPAFSTFVTDEFDETIWVPGSLEAVFVPAGWSITEASAGGVTTVTVGPTGDPDAPAPNQVIMPGQSGSVTFSMELVVPYVQTPVDNLAAAAALSLPAQDPAGRETTAEGTDSLLLPILDSEKAASLSPAEPGDVITYTVTVANTGDAPANNVVVVDDPDDGGTFQVGSVTSADGTVVVGNTAGDMTVQVDFASVAAGQTVSFSYDVLVPYPYPATGPDEYVNQALISSDEVPDFPSDDPATTPDDDPTVVPIIADPDVVITKTDLSDVVGAGGTVFYELSYANTGNQDDTGVFITDSVPANTTFNLASSTAGWNCADGAPAGTVCTYSVGDLGAGQGGVIYFAVTVDNPLPTGVTQIFNTAVIEDDGGNTDSDDEDTRVVAAPVLDITKDDGGISTSPNGTVVYQLDYVNNGTEDASGVRLRDTVPDYTVFDAAASLPDVWSCPDGSGPGTACTLQVGDLQGQGIGTGQARFAVRVDPTIPAGVTQIDNSVLIADDGNATLGIPIIALAFDDTPIVAAPDLVISKTDNAIIGYPGIVIPYTLEYFQVGDQDATGVAISETVPVGTTYSASGSAPYAWSCADGSPAGTNCTLDIGAMPVGASGTAVFAVQVDDPLPAGQSEVYNVVTIADDGSNGPDPTPANNTDDESTLVTLFAPTGRKSVTQTNDHQVTWRMVWFNNQNTLNLPVQVYDPIPSPAQYVGGSVICDATGASQCLSATYNAVENRVEVEAIIAPDFGAPDNAGEAQLSNEVVITFVTTVAQTNNLTNVADACWDENNSGTADDDRAMGQVCIPVNASIRAVIAIPVMGPVAVTLMAALLGLFGLLVISAGQAIPRQVSRK